MHREPVASLQVLADLENLRVIRRFVEEQAQLAGLPPQSIDDLVLAVDEAATNTVLHGYGEAAGTPSAVIDVEVEVLETALIVRLRDQAPPFDPTTTPIIDVLPPLTERGPGGLGIFLIRKTMDEFRYRRTPDGWNELTLSIHRPPAPQEN